MHGHDKASPYLPRLRTLPFVSSVLQPSFIATSPFAHANSPTFFSFFPWMIISWSRASSVSLPSSNNHVTSISIMCLLFSIESYLYQCLISSFELNCIFLISYVFLGHCSLIYPVTCTSLIIRKHFQLDEYFSSKWSLR